jgi:hypothetical protein
MSYRFTNTEKWSDAWFSNLKQIEMLLFVYLCDNCDIAGFIEVNYRRWANDLGSSIETIEGASKGLLRGLLFSRDGDCIYIRNFLKHQKNLPLNENNKAHLGILRRFDLYKHKFDIQDIKEFYEGGSKGLLSPTGNGIGNGKGKEEEGFGETNIQFETFWELYHKETKKPKTDKDAAIKKWEKLTKKERQLAIDKVSDYAKTNKPDFLKKARTYLGDKNFNDEMKSESFDKQAVDDYIKRHTA